MEQLKVNPNNKKYYSEDFIKGFECGVKRQFEVYRREGEWVDDPKNNDIKYCSNCELGYTKDFLLGMLPYYNPNPQMVEPPYCPNCGAKMKGAEE